jgi:nitrite reductase/ring-hydroxylating ferredoxin subunit
MRRRALLAGFIGVLASGFASAQGASKKPSPTTKSKTNVKAPPTPTPTTKKTPSPSPSPAMISELPVVIDGIQLKLSDLSAPISKYGTVTKSNRDYPVLISRPTDRTIKIFTARCPHQGTILNLENKGEFKCELHGARFDWETGKVLDGPTIQNLEMYEVIVKNDLIFVKA